MGDGWLTGASVLALTLIPAVALAATPSNGATRSAAAVTFLPPAYQPPAPRAVAYLPPAYDPPTTAVSFVPPAYQAPAAQTVSFTPPAFEPPAPVAPAGVAPAGVDFVPPAYQPPAGQQVTGQQVTGQQSVAFIPPAYESPAAQAVSFIPPAYEPPAGQTVSFVPPAYQPPAGQAQGQTQTVAFIPPAYQPPAGQHLVAFIPPAYQPPAGQHLVAFLPPAYQPPAGVRTVSFVPPAYQPPAPMRQMAVFHPEAVNPPLKFPKAINYPRWEWCVPFARDVSGINIMGNAKDWWWNAAGHYARGHRPEPGAVLAFQGIGRMPLGHVAVVMSIVNSREILIEQANWAGPGSNHSGISRNIAVIDVSRNNDWTAVRVGLGPRYPGQFGSVYPTFGFIYDRPDNGVILANTPGVAPTVRRVEVADAPPAAPVAIHALHHSLLDLGGGK